MDNQLHTDDMDFLIYTGELKGYNMTMKVILKFFESILKPYHFCSRCCFLWKYEYAIPQTKWNSILDYIMFLDLSEELHTMACMV